MNTLLVPSDGSPNSIHAVNLLLGSVTSRVACLVNVPVTLVK